MDTLSRNLEAYERLQKAGELSEVENLVVRGWSPGRVGLYCYSHPRSRYLRDNSHYAERAARYIRDGEQ